MNRSVIIVAGGAGRRMRLDLPKQFLIIRGMPLLMHTIIKFHTYDRNIEIIVAIPEDYSTYWEKLCLDHRFNIHHKIAYGGETRFQTVKNCIPLIEHKQLIAVHDGVRPLVSHDTIDRCFKMAAEKGTAIPCIPVPESIRITDDSGSHPVNRDIYRLIQTPQVFHWDILYESYMQPYQPEFTDDAGVVEKAGYKIHLVEGNFENIKVTTPADIFMVEALMGQQGSSK